METKEYILKTSLVLFLQKSYRDVTMSEIVEKTGLSKGAFYHYFTGKEALFREIASMFFSMGEVDYASFRGDSLDSFYHDYVDYLNRSLQGMSELVSDPGRKTVRFNFFLILFEAVSRFPDFLEAELEMHNRDLGIWKEHIASARKRGEIASYSTDEEIASLFLYCTDGVFLRFVNSDSPMSYRDYLLTAFDAIYTNLKSSGKRNHE